MAFFEFYMIPIIFLMGTFFLTAVNSAFRRIHKRESTKQVKALGNLFFYRGFHHYFFPHHEYEGLFFAGTLAQNLTRFFFVVSVIFLMVYQGLFTTPVLTDNHPHALITWPWGIIEIVGFLLAFFLIGDFLPRIYGIKYPLLAIKTCAVFASIFMFLSFPLTFIFLKISERFSRLVYFDYMQEPITQAHEDLIEILQQANVAPQMDQHDLELIESVVSFRDRIAREVMVPRVDVFSLPEETTIKQAALLLEKEGYSRTPVYRNSIDEIVGVLMYKDIMRKYMEAEQKQDSKILDAPIETIVKGVLYTPETKKISLLLQEFRKKQVHLAIIVDEYGGTEGIVTIEDILEQIVGEIEDEYDQEEQQFSILPDGSWNVDARMSILDVEEQLGILIPQNGDYDTIGGYIFHRAGSIPSKGFVIHHDNFDMEILRSNDRCVEKVKIKPIKSKKSEEMH